MSLDNTLKSELISCLSKAIELIYYEADENIENQPNGYVYVFKNEYDMSDAILFFKEHEKLLRKTHIHVIDNKEKETVQLSFYLNGKTDSIMTLPIHCKKIHIESGDDDSSNNRILWFAYLENGSLKIDYPTEYISCFTQFYFH